MINVFLFVFISNGDGQREITYQSVDCFRKQITTHFLSKIKKTKSSRVNGPKKGPGIFGSLMNMCANQSLGVNLNYAYKTGAFLTEMNYALYIYIYIYHYILIKYIYIYKKKIYIYIYIYHYILINFPIFRVFQFVTYMYSLIDLKVSKTKIYFIES